jgi:ribulose-phosphate 3-epimerase
LQLLAVTPGPSGQKFHEEILHKLGHIRSVCPECIIEIDGGVNQRIAAQCIKGGANLLVAGSAIFSASVVRKAIDELTN